MLIAVCAAIGMGVVGGGPAVAADGLDRDALRDTAALEVARDDAVRVYASDFGVSESVARRVLEEQAKGAGLEEDVQEVVGVSSFSQVTFTDGRYNVYVTDGAGDAARRVVAERGFAQAAVVRDVAWNADDLVAALRRTDAALAARMSVEQFQVTTADGRLQIALAPSVDETATREAAGVAEATTDARQVPVKVVRAGREFGSASLHYTPTGYGGPPWIAGSINTSLADNAGYSYACTTGFYSRALGNYFLTAGHCLFTGGHSTRRVCYSRGNCVNAGVDVGGYTNIGGDAGVIASWDVWPPYPAMLDWTNPVNAGIAVFGISPIAYGKFYCRTGIGTAIAGHSATTCGINTGLTVARAAGYPSSGVTVQTLRGNICGFGADSGGPYWDPYIGHAIGIHNGTRNMAGGYGQGCGTDMQLWYTDAGNAAASLGVRIATIYG
ncbi:MAG: hypothetical protein WBD40_09055 [Tepidisphaeraceae bacterium]